MINESDDDGINRGREETTELERKKNEKFFTVFKQRICLKKIHQTILT